MGDPLWFYKYLPIADFALGDEEYRLNLAQANAQEPADQEKKALFAPGAAAALEVTCSSVFLQAAGEEHQTFWNRIRSHFNDWPDALQQEVSNSRLGPLSFCIDNEAGNGYASTTDGTITGGTDGPVTVDDAMSWTSTDYVLVIDAVDATKYEVIQVVTSSSTGFNSNGNFVNSYADASLVYLLEWHLPGAWPATSPSIAKEDSTTSRATLNMTFQSADDFVNGYST